MKWILAFAAAVVLLVTGSLLWPVSAHSQQKAQKPRPLTNPLAEWQYPEARNLEASNGERLPTIPLQGLRTRTADPIEKVFLFYLKKTGQNFSAGWRPEAQITLLLQQFAQGGVSCSVFYTPRKEADSALMIVHQPKRTLTIQLSRDPQDKSATDVLLVADEH